MSLQPQRRYGPRTSIDRVVDALAAAGGNYRVRGDHIQASCPVHGRDRDPSLSIDYRDGKVWLHCQVCGDSGGDDAVVEALGLTWADLYDEKPPEKDQWRPPASARRKEAPTKRRLGPLPARLLTPPEPEPVTDWQIVKTYDYPGADGQLRVQSVRYERDEADPESGEVRRVKKFTQRWPDPERDGEWLHKAPDDYTPVPYRLPDVLAAIKAGQRVWLPEGEKDADAIVLLAAEATTNTGGASNFTEAHADWLAGADVAMVIDLDRAGWKRALHVHKLLTKRDASLRIFTPVVDGKGADATDHIDAGYGLDDFVEVSVDEAADQVATADIEAHAEAAHEAFREAQARLERAREATTDKIRETEERYARRWAADAGRRFVQADREYRQLGEEKTLLGPLAGRIRPAYENAHEWAAQAHMLTGAEVADDVRVALGWAKCDNATADDDPHGDSREAPDNVVDHPTSSRLPDPAVVIPMARGAWRYDLGGEGRPARGVYTQIQSRWVRVGPLPYVRARIVRRDGSGRRCGTDYLLACSDDGPGVIVDHQGLRDGSWANELGLSLSDDDKIMRATSTAIRVHADHVDEREETPRVDKNGRIAVPVAETLPDGYLTTAPSERGDALAAWKKVIELAAISPNMALALGAAAAAPYVGALNRQSHIVSLYGDAGEGKTTTIRAAGAIYGDSITNDAGGVISSWNTTLIGVIRSLGRLGCLPAFYDEQGMAGIEGPAAWGKVIYDITEGAQRSGAESRSTGVRRTKPWYGIFFSTANGRLIDGLGSGKFAGVGRRVIELGTPLTLSAAHAEAIEPLLPVAYGHIGAAILERYDTTAVDDLIARVDDVVPLPEEGNARTIAKHLQLHLAGALMLDETAGAGTTCYDAALQAACDYLDQFAPPEHDADRMLRQIRDAIAREPAMWPTVDEYKAHREPASWGEEDPRNRLPAHGVNRSLSGIRADDGSWVAVFAEPWRAMAGDEGIDSTIALRELHRRGILLVTESRRRRGEWKTEIRPTSTSMYKLALPEPDDDETDASSSPATLPDSGETGTDGGGWGQRWGSVGGDVGGTDEALTCDVGGVGGVGGQNTRVPAHARSANPYADNNPGQPKPEDTPPAADPGAGDEEAAMPADRRPCEVCGEMTIGRLDGTAVHLIDCAPKLEARASGQHTATDSQPELAPPDDEPRPAAKGPPPAVKQVESGIPAVVADIDGVWLPGGTKLELPGRERFAQRILDLAHDHGIRWRTKAVFEGPHVYITAGLAAELGALLEDLPDDREDADKALARHGKQLDWLASHEGGWHTSSQLGAWMNWRHPERGRARLVFLPYCTGQRAIAMAHGDPDPVTLARRLQAYAQLTGIPWRITAATTGLDLMHALRPRAKPGRKTRRVTALERPVEMPPLLAEETYLDAEVYWLRRPDEGEAGHKYLHWYDRNGQYLAAANRVYLGADVDPEHHPDGGVEIDQKRPGFVLVPKPAVWEDWLPNPWDPHGDPDRVVEQRWLPTTFASWLLELGHELEIVEAWLWPQSAAYLDPWVKVLREARHTVELHRADNPDADAMRPDIKATYTAGLGKLASRGLLDREGDRMRATYRPDWYSLIRGKSRANVQRLAVAVFQRSERRPVAIREDAIAYTSNEPDPIAAWPGDAAKLDDPDDPTPGKLGDMKPYKSGLLADVADLLRQQPYPITTRKIVDAMTDAAEWGGS